MIVVLAMHGMPPSDFPAEEKREFFALLSRRTETDAERERQAQARLQALEKKMRQWPRTPQNDAFHAASHDLAKRLSEILKTEVIVGFNEFCTPTVEEAIAQAAEYRPAKIAVVTPMMTRGGNHSEQEIPEEIARAQKRFPYVPIVYAWPFDDTAIADFLAEQIRRM